MRRAITATAVRVRLPSVPRILGQRRIQVDLALREFVEAYQQAFDQAPSFHAAGAFGACQLFVEAVRLAGSLDPEKLRDQLLQLETTTIFGDYAVDERGYQIANQGVFVQWQDGQKVIVWPDEVAVAAPRFPTPPWSER